MYGPTKVKYSDSVNLVRRLSVGFEYFIPLANFSLLKHD